MNEISASIIPFRAREPERQPQSSADLVGDLAALAHRFEAAGYQSVAALLVGLAFGIGRDPGPDAPPFFPRRA